MNRTQIIAILLGLVCLSGAGLLAPRVTASAGRHQLAATDIAEAGDPPEVALGIAMGAFRGIFVNFLWHRADSLKNAGRFHEAIELASTITKLQPRFPRVWVFHAWNLAYNVSVETQTPEERWQWVKAGIDLLRNEGIPANPNDLYMHKELAWMFVHKVGGYTDDTNRFYKRKIAEEWTIALGTPPVPTPDQQNREDVKRLYAEHLRRIADAHGTLAELTGDVPSVGTLLQELDARCGIGVGEDLLRNYTLHAELRDSVFREAVEQGFGPKSTAFAELMDDPRFADAWEPLVLHARKRLVTDRYGMELPRMVRYIEELGPIDFRCAAGHALYWARRGVEKGLQRQTEYNEKNFDFVNSDRMVLHAIQQLARYGTVYFNFLDFALGNRGFYLGVPNPYFFETYGEIEAGIRERGGVFESLRRARTNYSAGYENFLRDVVAFFYSRGRRQLAEQWYERLRTFQGQNLHDAHEKELEFGTLDEFAQEVLKDRMASPHVAAQQVTASLFSAYEAMLIGDTEAFRSQLEWANAAHRYFHSEQFRIAVAASGTDGRMEVIDRDFRYFSGAIFAEFMRSLPIDDAELAYLYAPEDLRRFAYDIMRERFEPVLTQIAQEADAGEEAPSFQELFPEPSNMDAFRQYIKAKEQQRSRQGAEGVQLN